MHRAAAIKSRYLVGNLFWFFFVEFFFKNCQEEIFGDFFKLKIFLILMLFTNISNKGKYTIAFKLKARDEKKFQTHPVWSVQYNNNRNEDSPSNFPFCCSCYSLLEVTISQLSSNIILRDYFKIFSSFYFVFWRSALKFHKNHIFFLFILLSLAVHSTVSLDER